MDPSIIFIPAMLVIFYFFIIRPQMAQQKKVKEFQSNIKKGQVVVTNGGIHGKVVQVDENQTWAMLDIGNTKIKIEKSAIVRLAKDSEDK